MAGYEPIIKDVEDCCTVCRTPYSQWIRKEGSDGPIGDDHWFECPNCGGFCEEL